MASKELLEFNEAFPNSKYREIYAQYHGDMSTPEGKEAYQKSKAPINTKIVKFDEIKDTENRIGWIVPKEYVVIDIDSKKSAKIVFDILQGLAIKFSYMTGRKGGHFIFKNTRNIKSISAGQTCSLGLTVDVRCNEKGYIVLPENDTDRSWGRISNDVADVPFFLIPHKDLKSHSDFIGMGEGSGRNDALLKHILSLIDYAKDISLDEKCESIRIINKYMFAAPLSEQELQKTVLRDEILQKADEEEEDDGCFEEKLASRIVKDKQIITCNDDCYIYNGKYYRKVTDSMELERIIHTDYNSNIKDQKRKEIVKFIKLKSWIPSSELDKNWSEIVCKNGILNLTTMELKPHTPLSYNTVYIDYNYIQDAPYSHIIDGFFNQISSREADKKQLLYEIIGYCLIRKNIFEKFFICYGEGSTGKSTYLKMIKNLIGARNSSFISLSNLEETYMPAQLFGKLVNIGDDIAYKGLKETDVLKKLVTGETFAAQQKFKEPLVFANFAKLIFTTNKLPEVYDRSSGFYRRVLIIDINNKIENPDPFFLDRLTEQDYEYLLSKSIEALIKAMQVNHLTESQSALIKLAEYKTDQSSVLTFCKDFGYTRDKLDHKPCMPVYVEYKQYCLDTGFKPLKKVHFDKELMDEMRLDKANTTWKEENNSNQTWRYVK